MKILACDFETTTKATDCRVWAWGAYEAEKDDFNYNTTISSFIEFLKNESKSEKIRCYFHNLKFDGEFIIYYLLKNNYTWIKSDEFHETNTFKTLITSDKVFYKIEMCFYKKGKHTQKVEILDSLKLLPFGIDKIAKAFNLSINKLTLDYDTNRPENHALTDREITYLKNDCKILGLGLKELFKLGLKSMTIGACALSDFKESLNREFRDIFPVLGELIDSEIRQAYKGGYVYVAEKYKGKELGDGIILDVNSLYSWAMYDNPLPFGEPKFFTGEYQYDEIYNIYIQIFTCQFELKENHFPTLQIKGSRFFSDTEYIKSSNDEFITLCLSSVDIEVFFTHYNVYNITYHSGYKFMTNRDFFKKYIDKWTKKKTTAKIENNMPVYTISKLMLNALYGKFGTNPRRQSSYPTLHNDIVKYIDQEVEMGEGVYLPMAIFITAYARKKTITAAQENYDRYIYSDTDSIHLINKDLPELEIHDTKLGAWKLETQFIKAKYLRQKSYVVTYEKDGELMQKVTVAGMTPKLRKYVKYDNFNIGTRYGQTPQKTDGYFVEIPNEDMKLRYMHVPGGVILEKTDFTIK